MTAILLLLFGLKLASAEIHSYGYIYTEASGIPGFPEFVSVGMVDGHQVSYFDTDTMKMVPRTEWVNGAVDPDFWNRNAQNCIATHQVFKNNIEVAKQRFNQTGGVHTAQQMYGCEWNDETGETNGFNAYGYDGEDFFSLDLKDMRYISPVQQALPTLLKWNNDKGQIENDKQYFDTICIEWLKKYLKYAENSLKKTVSPQVSLLQKDSSSAVLCHVTGFYPSGVKISWLKKGQDHYEDVDIGELLTNEDGTFQKTSTLKTSPDEWKKNQYSCVVEHQGKTINTILTEKDIITNNGAIPIGLIVGVVAAVILLVVIGAIGFMVYQKKKGKSGFVPANTSDGGSNNSSQAATA